jgi:flagellar protein FliS
MDEKLRRYYLESRVKNASPGQMLIMLYDCLIKNVETAEAEITSPANPSDPSQAAQAITGCINVMRELTSTLRPNENPSLCCTLSNLYLFFTRELSTAFEKRDPTRIRAILPLIRELRNTWCEADRRAGQLQAVAA